ncbi:F0F1 ATP synthase subunit delta [Aquisalimonas sp.]|uniref:F0F1 ATP synthase subunit delta n=1 Tax=unclassified Aquisalimonas TaxID=2644645 RepID=UPI0025B9C3E4|nr:F0F1 ATP synthase subunit delta [Aquisalimonas sp.]
MAADFNTIARPYAQAVFKLAREKGELAKWSDTLGLLAAVASDERVHPLLASPRLSPDQANALIRDICGEHLDDAGQNLVRLLAEKGRLIALAPLAEQYEALRAEEEGTLEATIVSAQPVDDKLQAELEASLGKRLKRKVHLTSEIDDRLMGGAIIRAGDLVIDGSVRGRLTRLATALNR